MECPYLNIYPPGHFVQELIFSRLVVNTRHSFDKSPSEYYTN